MSGLNVGTNGWSYDQWRDCFYQGIPRKEWLMLYAGRFSASEINASFYRLQKQKTFNRWAKQTPDDFRFTLKANRYLTHH